MAIIVEVRNPGIELTEVRSLLGEYARSLQEDLGFQGFEREQEDPLKKYGPPRGCLLLASAQNHPAGCIALTPLGEPGVCEMKRLFVRPRFRGQGLARMLCAELLQRAEKMGYSVMKLDTLIKLQPAIKLYESMGFESCAPYYPNPLAGVVYMKKCLNSYDEKNHSMG